MLRVGGITLVMLLILLTPALFGSHCDAFHRSFTLHLEGDIQFRELRIFGADREQKLRGAERKKTFVFNELLNFRISS